MIGALLFIGVRFLTSQRRTATGRNAEGVLSARSGRSSSDPDSGRPGAEACYPPAFHMGQITCRADGCCFPCLVILLCT